MTKHGGSTVEAELSANGEKASLSTDSHGGRDKTGGGSCRTLEGPGLDSALCENGEKD